MKKENIIDLEKHRVEAKEPNLVDIINGFTSHNCDGNRPYIEQQPKRAKLKIEGLTRRDICDCMVLGILSCRDSDKYGELPHVYVSEQGNIFHSFDDLVASNEGYSESYLDETKITYNDLYGWDLNEIDPIAAVQNMACYLERRMGVYPALLDGKLKINTDSE